MTQTAHLTVDGMSCEGCAKRLREALESVEGVSAVTVVLDGGQVTIAYDPAATTVADLREAVEATGFDAIP
ncbi:heavy-metal-associated domain-containing protein [Gluconobacter sp. NFX36]|uniref:heavy-metal-associated domain-containing protein n=1 Tax=Gluconobacter TaxID=441 RepID=UPI001B8D8A4B|nr:heavy-metal-associated domain-containing protein [Gluconobacter japonicus]MBS1049704.1 heavy-metal-associated domain-containing protein [Gluconobacter japonicus]